MTEKEFINALTGGHRDIVAILLKLLSDNHAEYCLIGGLAVNAYVEPVVSLDLDLAVATGKIDECCAGQRRPADWQSSSSHWPFSLARTPHPAVS